MHWFCRTTVATAVGWLVGHALLILIYHFGFPGKTSAIRQMYSVIISHCCTGAVAIGFYVVLTRYWGPEAIFDRETRCRACGYILKGIIEPRCPECGERI